MRTLIAIAIVCIAMFGFAGTNAKAEVLTLSMASYVGVVSPDGGNPDKELAEIDHLRSLAPSTIESFGDNLYERSDNAFSPALPDPTSMTFTKQDPPTPLTFTVNGYVLGKYDNDKAGGYVWYFPTPTEITLPNKLGDCGGGSGCGISHYEYNAGTSVPDGGLTLTLLGGALVGVETLRRKLRM